MDLHGTAFLFLWLPVSMGVYFLAPKKCRNAVLLVESLLFYAWGAPKYLPLALLLTMIGYVAGLALESTRRPAVRRALLAAAAAVFAGLLLLFKYGSFLEELLPKLSRWELSLPDVLPLGISYYSFKLISYLADVYLRRYPAERDPVAFGVYVLMFPQLPVGPISRYQQMAPALHDPECRCTMEGFEAGAQMFVFGLARKVLLADPLGRLWQTVSSEHGIGSCSTALVWLGVIAFSLQLYLDFSGYSEMSIGLCRMLGFPCAANFNDPYQATSIRDFWRRWHISLSSWFRDYIYIPLGGSRHGAVRRFFATLIVWLATGIWHGTGLNFLLWGLYHFLLLTIERRLHPSEPKKLWEKILRHLVVLLLVAVGWGIFAADSSDLLPLLRAMLLPRAGIAVWYYLRCYCLLLLAGILDSAGFFRWIYRKMQRLPALQYVCFAALLVLCIAFVIGGTGQAALYAAF